MNFCSADLLKKIEKAYSIELNKWQNISLDKLTEYRIRVVREGENSIQIDITLVGKTGHFMSVADRVYSVLDDQILKTIGGGGGGSGQPNYYSFTGNYEVEPFFFKGDYYVHLDYLTMEIGPYTHNHPRLMLIK
ncbi:hypothetical protein F8154_08760 [Alkaliphilus pronyensis]|uniref:Uncharacterized protein n=1 Tax=Alkaliphilus pronyensis TaxID=1482732 RepID=A0A6I0F4Q8_9FIRM|nr:hypothetical protein [Alkaliphilus pronyensis]KAB3534491.1 hypothetical protein F8154_08760 [Alkaliphilus pronyensis]